MGKSGRLAMNASVASSIASSASCATSCLRARVAGRALLHRSGRVHEDRHGGAERLPRLRTGRGRRPPPPRAPRRPGRPVRAHAGCSRRTPEAPPGGGRPRPVWPRPCESRSESSESEAQCTVRVSRDQVDAVAGAGGGYDYPQCALRLRRVTGQSAAEGAPTPGASARTSCSPSWRSWRVRAPAGA